MINKKGVVFSLSVLIACLAFVVVVLGLNLFQSPTSPNEQLGSPHRGPSVNFKFTPTSIAVGQSSTLTWSTTNATECTALGDWSGSKPLAGSLVVSPQATVTYILSCSNQYRTTRKTATLFVDTTNSQGTPGLTFAADPQSGLEASESTLLIWTGTNVSSCTASGGWSGTKATVGSQTLIPGVSTTYTLTCSNSAGAQVTRSVSVTVNDMPPPPPPPPPPPAPQCSDSVDNDVDGRIDYPADPGCTSSSDDDEFNASPSASNVMVPGNGFNGSTPVPAPQGLSTQQGFDATPIAHWETVPYQTFTGNLNVGILAYHFNEIAYVDFSVDGGPWTRVTTATENPQTGVTEYWAVLRASDFTHDGSVEVRAIVYPNVGQVKVMQGSVSGPSSSLFANANAGGSLPHAIRYVKKAVNGGNDSNSCLSATSACETITRAMLSAHINKSVDGLEIRLGAGDWQLPYLNGTVFGGAWWQSAFSTENQWLTFTPMSGLTSDDVFITGIDGPADGAGLGLKQVRFKNVSVVGNINKTPGTSFEDYIWFDGSKMFYRDPQAVYLGSCNGGFHGYNIWTGTFYTDIWMDNVCDGPKGATLARNVHVEHSGGGHSSGAATVVNYTVKTIYGSGYPFPWGTGPDYHGDLYQFGYGGNGDIIINGMRTVPGGFISSRGIAGWTPDGNIAIVNTNINTSPIWVFSLCSPINHMVIKNSVFIGSSSPWCGESSTGAASFNPALMRNILMDHVVFENGTAERLPYPWDLPGIKYIPAR